MDAARLALCEAIAGINAPPGAILEGVYSSQIEEYFDVENVVFYNIGTGIFKNASKMGLRARRCRLYSGDNNTGFKHKMNYRFIPTPNTPLSCLVHLRFIPRRLRHPFDVWWAAGAGQAVRSGLIDGAYGILVELAVPAPPTNPAAKIKVLLDGIIASLQADSEPDKTAVERLSRKHQLPNICIEHRLKNPIIYAIHTSRSKRLVRPFKCGVQWHPADDLCEECTLVVVQSDIAVCNAYVYALPHRASG